MHEYISIKSFCRLIKGQTGMTKDVCVCVCFVSVVTHAFTYTHSHTCFSETLAEFCCACSSACQFEASLVRLH